MSSLSNILSANMLQLLTDHWRHCSLNWTLLYHPLNINLSIVQTSKLSHMAEKKNANVFFYHQKLFYCSALIVSRFKMCKHWTYIISSPGHLEGPEKTVYIKRDSKGGSQSSDQINRILTYHTPYDFVSNMVPSIITPKSYLFSAQQSLFVSLS